MALTFDSDFYLSNNADVLAAVVAGTMPDALTHFLLFGQNEERDPNEFFDTSFYLANNADIQDALDTLPAGTFSVLDHYNDFGTTSAEGRDPNANFDVSFYLAQNADVAAAVDAGLTDALTHWNEFGLNENRVAVDGSGNLIAAGTEITIITDVPAVSGQTFTLTSGTDTFTGTAGNDTFISDLINEGGVADVTTWNNNDSLAGGAGTDTLTVTYDDPVTPLSLTGIEVLNLTDRGGNTLNLVNATDITTITITGSTGAVDIDNLAAIPTSLTLSNQSVDVDIDFQASAISGSDDTLALFLSANTDGDVTIDGVETIAVTSNGPVTNVLDLNDTATTLTSITVSGSANLTLNDTIALEAEVVTVDATGFTGNLNVTHDANAAVVTMTGGSGDDTFVLGAFYVGGASGATRDIIDGGAGTDSLSMTSARLVASSSAAQSNVTNVETIILSDALSGTVDLTRFSGATTLNLAAGGAAAANTVTVNSGSTIDIDADVGDEANTFIITGTGTTDTMTLNLAAGVDFLGTTGAGETFTGIETLNIVTTSVSGATSIFADDTILTVTAAPQSIVISGASAVTFVGAVTANVVDGSAMTGVLTLTTGLTSAATITGGAGADILNGSTAADIIIGGEGADVIDGLGGADSIVLTETTAAIDTVSFTVPGPLNATANAVTITNFATTSDNLSFDGLTLTGGGVTITATTGTVVTSGSVVAGGLTNDTINVISDGATALIAGGAQSIADFTDLADVAAYLAEGFTSTADNDAAVFVINDLAGNQTFIYLFDETTDAGSTIQVADLALIGIVDELNNAALVSGDIA